MSRADRKSTRFCKHVGRAINRFQMIRDGDRIIIGVSGGKDSLALCYALSERRRWVPIDYDLLAVHIDWREHPLPEESRARLFTFLQQRGLPFLSVKASIRPPSFRGKFNCYLCSRNRKRIFFEIAQKKGFHTIALGHTMDDVVETTLLNLVFGGEFSTMMPIQSFFEGRMRIIRPMVEVPEREVADAAMRLGFPEIPTECPQKGDSRRLTIREVIGELSRLNRRVRQNIFRSPWHIKTEYLPSSLAGVGKPP